MCYKQNLSEGYRTLCFHPKKETDDGEKRVSRVLLMGMVFAGTVLMRMALMGMALTGIALMGYG